MEDPKICTGRHGCQEPKSEQPHRCPYQEDVNDNSEFMCHCCETCTSECAADI